MGTKSVLRPVRLTALCALSAVAALTAACGSSSSGDDSAGASAGSAGNAGSASNAGNGGNGGNSTAGSSSRGGSSSTGEAGAKADGGEAGSALDPSVADYLNGFAPWGSVAPSNVMTSDGGSSVQDLKNSTGTHPFNCAVTNHDVTAEHDEILNFDSGAEYVKPGIMLVGDQFQKGNLEPIPLPRAPITLSIDVAAVKDATVVIDDPNVSNLQQGLATLQARAEATSSTGNYPAELTFDQSTVQSVSEMSYDLGVSAAYDGVFASANFSAAFASQTTTQQYTVVAKLMQTMYTVTFAQDDFKQASDFFSPSVTLTDIKAAEKSGFFAPDNPPVFIGSVTYGRMVVFTATSSQVSSASDLQTQMSAAGAAWSAHTDLTVDQKNFMSSLSIQVLSVGGDQAKVSTAIQQGNWSALYADADILSAVPLRYTVHALSGTRPVAAIGDTTQFTTSDCSAVKGWYQVATPPGVVLSDISTNAANNPVLALGHTTTDATSRPYRLDGEQMTVLAMPMGSKSALQPMDITVDDAGSGIVLGEDTDTVKRVLAKLQPGASAWSAPFVTDAGIMGAIDAGTNFIVGISDSYSDNQRDFFDLVPPATSFSYRVDDAQNDVRDDGPWFSVAGSQFYYVYWGAPQIESRTDANLVSAYSNDAASVNSIKQLSAVDSSTIYALLKDGTVGKLNLASKKFDTVIQPPTSPGPQTLKQIEAGGNGELWATTQAGTLYHYVP